MCFPAALAALGLGGGAAAATTAAGAMSLANIGTVLSVAGTLASAAQQSSAANQAAQNLENQRATEAQLNATQDQRERARMTAMIRQQTAELAARGVALDSPTAIALGQTAAQEMSFDSQAVRQTGRARDQELSAEARMARGRAGMALLRGGVSAAGTVLDAGPQLWPGLGGGGAKQKYRAGGLA